MAFTRQIYPLAAALLLLSSLPTFATIYRVEMDDIDWQLHEDKYFRCSLHQQVPLFGSVTVSARAGRQL